jgi:hypothetical protein
VHALFYSGFLEDPLTWLVIGLAAALLRRSPAGERRAEVARRVTQREGSC